MYKSKFIIIALILISNFSFGQTERKIPIEKYFITVDSLEYSKLKEKGIITEQDSIALKYQDQETKRLNSKGFEKYAEVKAEVYMDFFKNLLLLQTLNYKSDVYALYFSVAGFDDIEFQILRWEKSNWDDFETIEKTIIDEPNQNFQKVAFNYDEGPKNLGDVKIFIQNDYLIMERSGLYHSLYDLKTNKLLINEESPWHSAEDNSAEGLNKWINENLHRKIEEKIKNAYR